MFNCWIVIVLRVHIPTNNFGGAKMYFRTGAVRTAAEALRVRV